MSWYAKFWNIVENVVVEAPKVIEEVPKVAAIKGQIGELWVEEVLCKKFSAVRHKKNKAGDLKLITEAPTKVVMIEVKNYERTVPEGEIDKFYRDLLATSWDAGIFIEIKPSGNGVSYKHYKGVPCMFLSLEMGEETVLSNAVELFISFVRRDNGVRGDESWRLMMEFADKLSELSQIKLRLGEFGNEMEKLGYQLQQFINGYKQLVSEVAENVVGMDGDLDTVIEGRATLPAVCKTLAGKIGKWKVLKTCLKSECGNYSMYFRKGTDELHWKCSDKKIIMESIEMGAGYKERTIILDLDKATLKWFLAKVGADGK
nr:hypothetical protein K-LCC10_0034 [Kaumoebavirus]